MSHYGQSDLPGSGTRLGDWEQCELGKTRLVLLLEAVTLPVHKKKKNHYLGTAPEKIMGTNYL